ncbi:MAG: ATP-binding protein [Deltaproteobacteria bacterium]|nr:ATP-binding protein [Deltaproteobacteria bacterium]
MNTPIKNSSFKNTPHTGDNMASVKRTRIFRIGLLGSAILLGVFLVSLGVFEYRDARANGYRITQAQALHMMLGFQQQMRHRQAPSAEDIRALFDMLREQGVNRIAVYENGTLIDELGAGEHPLTPAEFDNDEPPEPVTIRFITDAVVHARILLPKGPPGGGRMGRLGRERRVPLFPHKGREVLLEMRPGQAIAMRERAFQIMVVDIIAAILLMGAAIVFWRLSVRQEHLMQQLEKDRQLKLLGQMSAVLGHELKNTIASVKGHAQLLVEKLAGAPHESNARIIERDAVYLQNLTEQMLAFARTGAMHMEKVYLDDLAEAAVTFSDATDVAVKISGTEPTFFLDRHKMQQVLTNLINNAHQSGATHIALNISLDGKLTIDVSDNGEGMDETQQNKIFDPFFTSRAKGTGLGLALARRIVEAHNGTIEVSSVRGRGTTFTVVVPQMASAQMKKAGV